MAVEKDKKLPVSVIFFFFIFYCVFTVVKMDAAF